MKSQGLLSSSYVSKEPFRAKSRDSQVTWAEMIPEILEKQIQKLLPQPAIQWIDCPQRYGSSKGAIAFLPTVAIEERQIEEERKIEDEQGMTTIDVDLIPEPSALSSTEIKQESAPQGTPADAPLLQFHELSSAQKQENDTAPLSPNQQTPRQSVSRSSSPSLHEQLYGEVEIVPFIDLQKWLKVSALLIGGTLLTTFFFPRRLPLLSQNAPLSQLKSSLESQNRLELENLAEIPVSQSNPVSTVDETSSQLPLETSNPTVNPSVPEKPQPPQNPTMTGQFAPTPLQSVSALLPDPDQMMIVDRYYLPQSGSEDESNQSMMTIVDRYYLQKGQEFALIGETTPATAPAPAPVNPASLPMNTSDSDQSQILPPPPPPTAFSGYSHSTTMDHRLITAQPLRSQDGDLTYILTGVISLGAESAALFQSGETVLRLELGASLGGDWRLDSIANGQAILVKNGQYFSLQVGESFTPHQRNSSN